MADIKQCKEDFERKLEELKAAIYKDTSKHQRVIDEFDKVVWEYENYFEPKINELIKEEE